MATLDYKIPASSCLITTGASVLIILDVEAIGGVATVSLMTPAGSTILSSRTRFDCRVLFLGSRLAVYMGNPRSTNPGAIGALSIWSLP